MVLLQFVFNLWFKLLTKRRLYFLYLRCRFQCNRFGQNTEVGQVSTQYIHPLLLPSLQTDRRLFCIYQFDSYIMRWWMMFCVIICQKFMSRLGFQYTQNHLLLTIAAQQQPTVPMVRYDVILIFTDGTFLLYCLNMEL